MERILILLFFVLIQINAVGQTINYTESSEIIANPERGLQKYSITGNNYATNSGANNLSVSTLSGWKNSDDKVTVVYRYFLLEDFMNSDINTIYLDNIQGDFDNVRTAGLKVIVRFSYSNSEGNGAQQPSKAQILSHISQLSSILNSNKDVIFSVQAGFIGTWGEWYYTNSTEFGTEDDISNAQWANRKDVVDAMLAAVPIGIPLQVRYVGIKTNMYGNNSLTSQTAYQNTANARIGFYNDAFLNDWGDQGTYSVNNQCTNPVGTTEYNYLSNETLYLPMTGETNGLNSCNSGSRTKGPNAINEMELTNWTTINRDYFTPFWNQLIASNNYDEILKNLGYRFVLESSTVAVNGLDFDITINLGNSGFARAFKERDVYLVLKNTQTNNISTHLINTDIRTWENSVSITQNIDPGLIGSLKLYLWMADKEPSLSPNPDYSIRFANDNTWESSTGYNDLMQTVDLICSSSTGIDTRTECDSYAWVDGNTYTSSNNIATFNIIGGAANGCDSLVSLDLTIISSTVGVDSRIVCDSFTWIDGNTYNSNTTTSTYNIVGGAANGCDSLVTLDLIIINSIAGTDSREECDSYTWIDGNTYTSSNSSANYNIIGGAANGCDSLVILDLTIITSSTGTDSREECDSYIWIDGNTYTSNNNSANFNIVGGASNGCDSLVTLDLSIISVSDVTLTVSEQTITANNSSASYQWLDCNDGNSIIDGETNISFTPLMSGDYAVELTENGCQDTSVCVSIISVGLNESDFRNQFAIYPNPASEFLTLRFTHSGKEDVQIYDVHGQKVMEKSVSNNQRIDISQLLSGVYYMHVISRQLKSYEFVKQ